EQQDIGIANQIYQTLLGHPMDDATTQSLAKYITNGVLDRFQFAWDSIDWSPEYNANYGMVFSYSGGYPVYYYYESMYLRHSRMRSAGCRLPRKWEFSTNIWMFI